MSRTAQPRLSTVPDDAANGPSSGRPSFGLSVPQVVGSALAAATSALAASFLGVAGTLIGAVVGAVIATIGGAVYSHSLVKAATQLRVIRPGERLAAAGVANDMPNAALAAAGYVDDKSAPATRRGDVEPELSFGYGHADAETDWCEGRSRRSRRGDSGCA